MQIFEGRRVQTNVQSSPFDCTAVSKFSIPYFFGIPSYLCFILFSSFDIRNIILPGSIVRIINISKLTYFLVVPRFFINSAIFRSPFTSLS